MARYSCSGGGRLRPRSCDKNGGFSRTTRFVKTAIICTCLRSFLFRLSVPLLHVRPLDTIYLVILILGKCRMLRQKPCLRLCPGNGTNTYCEEPIIFGRVQVFHRRGKDLPRPPTDGRSARKCAYRPALCRHKPNMARPDIAGESKSASIYSRE